MKQSDADFCVWIWNTCSDRKYHKDKFIPCYEIKSPPQQNWATALHHVLPTEKCLHIFSSHCENKPSKTAVESGVEPAKSIWRNICVGEFADLKVDLVWP